MVVNDEGWIVTAAHIFTQGDQLANGKRGLEEYEAKLQAIESEAIPKKLKGKRTKALGKPDPAWVRDFSFWWGANNVDATDIHLFSEGDLAIARLQPFDGAAISNYPVFKNPIGGIDPGTSLCRLGFPFHVIRPTFDNGTFQLPPGTFPMVFFPNEGILTRIIEIAPGPPVRTAYIETSSAGLRGQSGGPIFDREGVVWGIQSKTAHLPLGFSPPVPGGRPDQKEHQFMNVGLGVHPATITQFFTQKGVKYALSAA